MARRRMGREVFQFGARAERQTRRDELGSLIDWPLADRVLAWLFPGPKAKFTTAAQARRKTGDVQSATIPAFDIPSGAPHRFAGQKATPAHRSRNILVRSSADFTLAH